MTAFEIIDISGQVAGVVYVITFYWIVRTVRKENLQEVKGAVKNPFWPNLDLAFIPWVYKTYIEITQSALVPMISIACVLIALIAAFISFFN